MKNISLEKLYLYPILFPSVIILTLAGANLIIFTYWEIAKYSLAACLIGAMFFSLIYIITRDGDRSSFLVFLITVWGCYFGSMGLILKSYLGLFMSMTQEIIFLIIWTGFFGFIGSSWLWRRIKKNSTITTYFNVLSIVLIIFLIARIEKYQNGKIILADYGEVFPMINDLHPSSQTPDIYYIILDAYGRADTLSTLYSYNNQAFINYLKTKGFYIANASQSNYVQTVLSLSSSLNFDYLPNLPADSLDGRPLIQFIQQNRIMRIMESLGYKTYAFQTPYEAASITRADHFYASVKMVRTNALIGLLMSQSVASIGIQLNWITPPFSTYGDLQNLVTTNLAELPQLAKIPGQKFIFLHLLIPHPPFIFNQDGPITPEAMYFLSDSTQYTGPVNQYIAGYSAQAEYLNSVIEQTINSVLENSRLTPIIILQGDHGPGAYFAQTVDETCLKERFGILNAFLLPDGGSEHLYQSISPVNTFRVILNTYFGGKLELLEDKHFYSSFTHPYRFIDVSGEVNKECNIK